MPILTISFNVPSAAVPRLQELLAKMNEDRVTAGDPPFTNVNDMAEQILKNRLRLLVKEGEQVERDRTRLNMKAATPEQIERIKAILAEEGS